MSLEEPKPSRPSNETPLQGWKEIAAYLERDQRTARRWELVDGLPIRRLRTERRSSVYAYPSEIEDWRTTRPSTAAAEQAEPQNPPRPRRLIPALAMAAAVVVAVLVIRFGPVLSPPSPIAEAAQDGVRTELVWPQAKISPEGSVSPDGKFVTYVDWGDAGNLAIRNLETGENRRLTQTADWGPHHASGSRISPDGERVSYSWFLDGPVGGSYELRLLTLGGDPGQPRTIWSPGDGIDAFVQDWFPDGDRVLAVVTKLPTEHQIVTVSVPDGEVQQIRSIAWSTDPQVRVSPDGRHIAYSRSASRDEPAKDIFLVAVDGSSESAVVQHTANDELVGWSPNGDYLLINSDRSGQPGLWVQPLENAAPAGQLQLIVPNVDVAAGMGLAQDGSFYYAVRVSQRRLKLAEIDLRTGNLLAEPKNAVEQFVGRNLGGRFSPNGKEFVYLSGRQGWNDRAIVVRSLATGEEREVPHDLCAHYLIWPPGRDSLIVQGHDDRDRRGLFDVSLANGHAELIAEGGSGVLSPDGAHLFHSKSQPYSRSIQSYRLADGSVETVPGDFGGRFSVLPDGRIATNSRTEIRLHPLEGADTRVLWSTDEQHRFGRWTVWAPDREALLVLRQDPEAGDEMWRLWVAPVDGSLPYPTELVHEPANAGSSPLEIHPDGRRILHAEGGYFFQLWAMRNLPFEAREQATE
jgi:hypothetical protein